MDAGENLGVIITPAEESLRNSRYWLWSWPIVKLPSHQKDRRTIAHHEAAHAVLLHLFGLPIAGASVYDAADEDGVLGYVQVGECKPPVSGVSDQAERERAAINLAAIYLGGIMAELHLHELQLHGRLFLPGNSDFIHARNVLLKVFGWDRALYFAQLHAAELVAAHWGWIARVADALLAGTDIGAEYVGRARC